MAADSATPKKEDVAVLLGRGDGGEILALRSREGRTELAEMRQLQHGQPINSGEVASLRRREDNPLLWDVDVHYACNIEHAGPPRVASQQYRRGWDAIFSDPEESETLH